MNPTACHFHAGCRGFTLVEAVGAVALLGITLTASISSLTYVMRNDRFIAAQSELDMDASLLVERLRRDLWRTARDQILVHPPGDGPYQAISFPIVRGNEPITLNEEGNIDWDATVVYHLKDGTPSEVRRTVFEPRTELTAAERALQLANVVADGDGANTYNSANALTRTLIENPVEWELNISGTRFDAYAPSAGRRFVSMGTALMADGDNTLTFRTVGKNSANDGESRALGVDMLSASGSSIPREGEWQTVTASQGASPLVDNMGEGEIWSGNSRLWFPATVNDSSFSLAFEHDRWEERNFSGMGVEAEDIVRTFIQPETGPHTFALRLDGNGTAWTASNQTRNTSSGGSTMTNFSQVAVRVFVRGADLMDSEGFDGGWIAFNGTNVWARFARGPWGGGGMHLRQAFIAQSAIMTDPANNPLNIDPASRRVFLFSGSEEIEFPYAVNTLIRESDKLDFLIEKTNSYVVGMLLTKNTANALQPSVFHDSADTVGPNCGLILNPSADQAAGDFDWSSLPATPISNQWTQWETASTDRVYQTSRIVGLHSLRTGHAPDGLFTSQQINTQLADPGYLSFGWSATQPSNSTLELKVRAWSQSDQSDAAAWADVPVATLDSPPVINGRFAQVQVKMEPGTDALSTPELRDFTLRWSGGRRYVDLAGIFSEGPNHGIYEVLVNDAPLLQGVTVHVSVFKDVRLASGQNQRMVSSAFAEIVPRN